MAKTTPRPWLPVCTCCGASADVVFIAQLVLRCPEPNCCWMQKEIYNRTVAMEQAMEQDVAMAEAMTHGKTYSC
jgi:hypothetical protein